MRRRISAASAAAAVVCDSAKDIRTGREIVEGSERQGGAVGVAKYRAKKEEEEPHLGYNLDL